MSIIDFKTYRDTSKEADQIRDAIEALQALLKHPYISDDLGMNTENCICELDDALESRNNDMSEYEDVAGLS